jgi:hypothetical protein
VRSHRPFIVTESPANLEQGMSRHRDQAAFSSRASLPNTGS